MVRLPRVWRPKGLRVKHRIAPRLMFRLDTREGLKYGAQQSGLPSNTSQGEANLEKTLSTVAYWVALISTMVAVVLRGLAVLGIFLFPSTPAAAAGRIPISYRTFLEGAILFFVMAIASSVLAWAKEQKS